MTPTRTVFRTRHLCALALLSASLAACSPASDGSGTEAAPEAAAPASPALPPPPPADPLAVGPQEAKDALYCSALIFAENPQPNSALAPVDEALRMKAEALGILIGDAGLNQLIIEGHAHATHTAAIVDAYAAKVEEDRIAGATRISIDDCLARASALPPVQ